MFSNSFSNENSFAFQRQAPPILLGLHRAQLCFLILNRFLILFIAFWTLPIFNVTAGFRVAPKHINLYVSNPRFSCACFYCLLPFLFRINWNFSKIMTASVAFIVVKNDFDFAPAYRTGLLKFFSNLFRILSITFNPILT